MAMRKAKQDDEPKESETTSVPVEQGVVAFAAHVTTAATRMRVSAPRLSRGPVDAPGKRHRKPQPNKPIDTRMGEPRGKQMGQKSLKNSPRGR